MKHLPPGASPTTQPREQRTKCRRDCCWTPLGHSTVRDHLPTTHPHACHCHREEKR